MSILRSSIAFSIVSDEDQKFVDKIMRMFQYGDIVTFKELQKGFFGVSVYVKEPVEDSETITEEIADLASTAAFEAIAKVAPKSSKASASIASAKVTMKAYLKTVNKAVTGTTAFKERRTRRDDIQANVPLSRALLLLALVEPGITVVEGQKAGWYSATLDQR